jgi:protein-disulfide isomerase
MAADRPVGAGNPFGGWKIAVAAGLLGAAVGAGGMLAASGTVVRGYLLEHPEVLPEAMQRLEARQAAKSVGQSRSALETPFAGAWAGARDADVVLVEFFDYACGFCRKSNADVERLLAEDPKLKVVWRDWPVLGPDSEAAARTSLAAARQGRFKPFHDALFAKGRPSPEAVADAARSAGVDLAAAEPVRTAPATSQEIARNYQLASQLWASGTPTFVVGDRILQGAVGYDVLKDAVAAARQPG